MSDFEKRLSRALSEDDEAFLKDLEDGRGLFAQLGATMSGPVGKWAAFIWIAAMLASAVGLYAVWQMFQAETTRGLILWAAAGWAAWTIQISVKQWVYDRANMLTILRELKKVELRLARIEDERTV